MKKKLGIPLVFLLLVNNFLFFFLKKKKSVEREREREGSDKICRTYSLHVGVSILGLGLYCVVVVTEIESTD